MLEFVSALHCARGVGAGTSVPHDRDFIHCSVAPIGGFPGAAASQAREASSRSTRAGGRPPANVWEAPHRALTFQTPQERRAGGGGSRATASNHEDRAKFDEGALDARHGAALRLRR
jgi:hypothetical protein